MTTWQDVEKLKSEGRYIEAGRAAYAYNPNDRSYGAHFGMRSDRAYSMTLFFEGFDAARAEAEAEAKSGRSARKVALDAMAEADARGDIAEADRIWLAYCDARRARIDAEERAADAGNARRSAERD